MVVLIQTGELFAVCAFQTLGYTTTEFKARETKYNVLPLHFDICGKYFSISLKKYVDRYSSRYHPVY